MQQPVAFTGENTPKEDLKKDPNRDPKRVLKMVPKFHAVLCGAGTKYCVL